MPRRSCAVAWRRPGWARGCIWCAKNPEEALQWHRAEAWHAEAGITLHRADAAVAIDRERRSVRLASGRELAYATLVLATGTRARKLPHLTGNLANVASLRIAVSTGSTRTERFWFSRGALGFDKLSPSGEPLPRK